MPHVFQRWKRAGRHAHGRLWRNESRATSAPSMALFVALMAAAALFFFGPSPPEPAVAGTTSAPTWTLWAGGLWLSG